MSDIFVTSPPRALTAIPGYCREAISLTIWHKGLIPYRPVVGSFCEAFLQIDKTSLSFLSIAMASSPPFLLSSNLA
jgi:hypothetical protein